MNEDNNHDFNVGWRPEDTHSQRIRGLRDARGEMFSGKLTLIASLVIMVYAAATNNDSVGGFGSIIFFVGIGLIVHAKYLEYKFRD